MAAQSLYVTPLLPSTVPSESLYHSTNQMFCSNKPEKSGRVGRKRPKGILAYSSSPPSSAVEPPLVGSARERSPAKHTPSKLRILIAGGGIGGLAFALAAKRKGFDVMVFEKDMSAIRGEGKYRGPIQLQSNALAALEAIDPNVADEIMREGCVTGDRINGLVDGISGEWYIKFDTFTPAVERGLPVTRVISRLTLQDILARAVGDDLIMNSSNVVDFVDDGNKIKNFWCFKYALFCVI